MKRVLLFLAVICGLSVNAQQLKLDLHKKSDQPNIAVEHTFVFNLINTSINPESIEIITTNTNCKDIPTNKQSQLVSNVSDKSKSKSLEFIQLKSGEKSQFSVTLKRPKNITLNTYSCTKVMAKTEKGLLSNPIILKSYIPDPKLFQ
ncbi:MAG: hypothetical protein ACWA5P_12100 [bacterium]